ncbi:hypothetical protein ACJJTC_014284 [Scirpophaga incertulas]
MHCASRKRRYGFCEPSGRLDIEEASTGSNRQTSLISGYDIVEQIKGLGVFLGSLDQCNVDGIQLSRQVSFWRTCHTARKHTKLSGCLYAGLRLIFGIYKYRPLLEASQCPRYGSFISMTLLSYSGAARCAPT